MVEYQNTVPSLPDECEKNGEYEKKCVTLQPRFLIKSVREDRLEGSTCRGVDNQRSPQTEPMKSKIRKSPAARLFCAVTVRDEEKRKGAQGRESAKRN